MGESKIPEYLMSGVYIEEVELDAKPIEGTSTSTAGFLGMTERGPEKPTLVTSFEQYLRRFGGYLEDSYMTYAVEGFFKNGGKRCLIGRVVKGAKTASTAHKERDNIKYTAVGKGAWGNRVAVRLDNASIDPSTDVTTPERDDLFKLTVIYWPKGKIVPHIDFAIPSNPQDIPEDIKNLLKRGDLIVEVFDNLSIDKFSPDYFEEKVSNMSNLVDLTWIGSSAPTRPDNTTDYLFIELTNHGSEGNQLSEDDFVGGPAASLGEKTGLTAFKEIDEISILYLPDLYKLNDTDPLINELRFHCEYLKDRFAVLDAPPNTTDISTLWPPDKGRSKYIAYYYPWIKIFDPLTKDLKLIPPGGHVVGIYARTDTGRGVHKAPANAIIRGALDVEFRITNGEQNILNPRGVNCIRSFPGRGIRVWAARTTSQDPLWKYINVRRLVIYLEESIEKGTQWVVFEPNDEKLWDKVEQTVTQFLTRVWKDGALMGTTPEEAFFVKCDQTTMTQDDIDNGRLVFLIGVAPVKPAEFVIFRIAHWHGGSEITE